MTAKSPIRYAASVARRWHGWLMAKEPADTEQALWLAVLSSDGTLNGIQAAVTRTLRAMARDYGYVTGRRDPVAAYTEDAGYRRIKADPNMRPSKCAKRTGYRRDASRHSAARMKLTPERRSEIARIARRAQLARKGAV